MLAVAIDLNCDVITIFKSDLVACLNASADPEIAGKTGHGSAGF